MADPVGEIPIIITGDASDLEKALARAADAAKAASDKIGDSMGQGFNQASQSAYKFTEAAQSIIDKQKALELGVIQAKGALVDISLAYEQGAASAVDMVRAQENLVSALKRASVSVQELKPALDEANGGFKAFAEGVGNFIQNPLQAAGQATTQFLEAIGPMGAAVGAAAVTVGILGKEITSLVLTTGQWAEKTSNLADKLNLSFQDTKRFSDMAQVAGVNINVLERASARLAVALEDSGGAGKKVALALDDLGIYTKNSGEALVQLLEKLAAIPDATKRIEEANKIMGRGAAVALEPMLKNFDSLQAAVLQLGGSISNEMVSALTKADDAADLLGIAWGNLKGQLAATFAPAVTAGLELLTKVISGTPTNTLEQQLMNVNEQLIKMQTNSINAASTGILSAMFSGGAIATFKRMGGAFSPDTSEIDRGTPSVSTDEQTKALANQKAELEGLIEAQKRSKELNAEIDKSNREAEIFKQGAAQREQDRLRAEWQANNELIKLQKAQSEQLKALTDDLKFFHVIQSDPVIENAKLRMAQLTLGYYQNKVSLKDLTQAQSDYNKVFGYDFKTYAENALTLIEQMDQKWLKLSTSIAAQRELLRSPEFAGRAQAVLADLNSNVPSDAARDAVAKGTPLGDAMIRQGIDRDSGSLKSITDLNIALKDEAATLDIVDQFWIKANGAINALARVNLPAAIKEYQSMIQFARDHGAAYGTIIQLQERELQLIIEERTRRNESVTEQMIQLENLRIAEEARRDRLQAMGKLYSDLMQTFKSGFVELNKAIADNLIEWKSWSDTLENVGKDVAKHLLESIITGFFKPLEDKLTGLEESFSKVITKGVGGLLGKLGIGGGGGGSPVQLPGVGDLPVGGGIDLGGVATAVGGGGGGGGAAAAASSLLTAASGAMPFVQAGISAAAGITQGIQMAMLLSDTGKIEVNTRQCKELLMTGVVPPLLQYLPELKHLADIWGTSMSGFDKLAASFEDLRTVLGEILADARFKSGGSSGLGGGFWGSSSGAGARTPEELAAEQARNDNQNTSNVVRTIGRGFTDLSGTITEGSSRSTQGSKPSAYQLKPGEQFASEFSLPAPLTTAQALAAGGKATGLTAEQYKILVDAQFKAHPDWYPEGTLPSDIYQQRYSVNAPSSDPLIAAQQTAQRAALEDYRAGIINLTEYNKRNLAAIQEYQDATRASSQAQIDLRIASDPLVQAYKAQAETQARLNDISNSMEVAMRSYLTGGAQVDFTNSQYTGGINHPYLSSSPLIGNAGVNISEQVAQAQAGINAWKQQAISDGQAESAKVQKQYDDLVNYITTNFDDVHQVMDRMGDALSPFNPVTHTEGIAKGTKAQIDAQNVRNQDIFAQTSAISKEQVSDLSSIYSRSFMSLGADGQVSGGLQGTDAQKFIYAAAQGKMLGGTTSTMDPVLRYIQSIQSTIDAGPTKEPYQYQVLPALPDINSQLAVIASKTAGIVNANMQPYLDGLMARLQPYTPVAPSWGAGFMGMNSTTPSSGGSIVSMPVYVYTNDPQVTANILTTNLWQNGVKTR